MARKMKLAMRLLIKKRDKAFEKLVFNERLPSVLEAQLDQANEKLLLKKQYQSKKRLFPLELAATADSIKNSELQEIALKTFKDRQIMPRRAIQQTYLRKAKKIGEKEAQAYRNSRLSRLDQAVRQYQSRLHVRYPLERERAAAQTAVERYVRAQKEETASLHAFMEKCESRKEAKLRSVNSTIKRENLLLEKKFDSYNLRLQNAALQESVPKDSILCIKDLHMHFAGIRAVDGLSLDVKKGEIFGLIGPNGAGKTTLFNCITQFHKATSGELYYRDRFDHVINLSDYMVHDVIRTGIARTFQNLEMVLDLSVLDNLLVGSHTFFASNLFDQFLHTKRLREEEEVTKARALEVLEELGLIEYRDASPGGLPYGILKRIELARTLMARPRLIILDEPAAGLNDKETEDLAEIIRKIRDEYDCTIFLVEHDMNLVMNVCDTVCAISFGRKLAIGTPEEIQCNLLVQEAYLGEMEEA